jgi:exonuclease SbcD
VRILHTSDWHLGRSFHRVDLLTAQSAFLDHLVQVVRQERVDAVLVAGDVYDRALPGVEAVTLLDETLARLVDAGAVVVVTSGNHDSARRLGFGARLLDAAGVHVRTGTGGIGEPVSLADRYGPVACYPLPFLEPALSAEALGTGRTHPAVLGAAMDRVRQDLAGRPAGTRGLVLAHAFVTGAQPSDSERELAVGGLGDVPATVFDGVDYAALGHLHGRQELLPSVRYSGSPLAYSFSESAHVKGYWLVELEAHGLAGVTPVPAPVPRRLARLRGQLADLLADPRHAAAEDAWCQVTLTDPARPAEPMDAVRRRFPHTLELRLEPEGGNGPAATYTAQVTGRSDVDVCRGFLEHVRQRPASAAEAGLLGEAVEAARAGPREAE